MNHDLMTVKDVAGYLRLSDKTVYGWFETGRLPGYRIGRSVRFKFTEVVEFVQAGKSCTVDVAEVAKKLIGK